MKRAKAAKAELSRQEDPRAPLASEAFLASARPVLKRLADDLLARVGGSPGVSRAMTAQWERETRAHRTADAFEVWRRNLVAQVAAAWLLSVVFVRTFEDRGLLDRNRIAGPGAMDSQLQFLQIAPYLTERDYLLSVFRELTRIPAAAGLFDPRHSLVWRLAPSAEGAKALLALFRSPEADAPTYRFGQSDTRFLGDLYQDLDEDVRARYALLQTPRFIESFILDRTLERSVEEFGLDATTMIDPTCGSGHFLLGAFERLYEHRLRKTPGLDRREAVRLALEAVHGVDINPYSIAIARVRMTLAAMEKGGYAKLKSAPVFPMHLVVADSLLHRVGEGQMAFGDRAGESVGAWKGEAFALEEEDDAKKLLAKRFAVVVGNPPYITVKDAALRGEYRKLYRACHREYSLAAPFAERFFQLGRAGGFVGQITANSFMKREFGKKLIEEVLPAWNLELVVNTSGAYIPGHGTPTVLLFGRNEAPALSRVHAVLAKRGEPSTPKTPELGLVWRSIADHWNETGFENEYVSVATIDRDSLSHHPCPLAGGGAAELKKLLEGRAERRLEDVVELIGFGAVTREDDAFVLSEGGANRWSLSPESVAQYGFGEIVRDWSIGCGPEIVFPYGRDGTLPIGKLGRYATVLWRYRAQLWLRQGKGFKTKRDAGGEFYEYSMFYPDRHFAPLKIAFAFVATHNHFVLDRGGKVFNRSAPIIKLPEGATEEEHLALLGYLNSSTAAFFFRQAGHSKGIRGEGGGITAETWEQFLEFSGALAESVPLPHGWQSLASVGRRLDALGAARAALSPHLVVRDGALGTAREREEAIFHEMVAVQEELDFAVYRLWGLIETSRTFPSSIQPGSRAFEYDLAATNSATRWFSLNGYAMPDPATRPNDLAELPPAVRLIEQPEYKRRWTRRDWDAEVRDAARVLLAELTEAPYRQALSTTTARQVVHAIENEARERKLDAALNVSGDDLGAVILEVLGENAVPFLAALRYTDAGLEKRTAWEATWALQRREDAGDTVTIPAPSKYDSKDYRDTAFWRLRGKLDVPKERFISYPGCESDEDKSPLYGWAGWNHLQQAQALAALYLDRKDREAWQKDRLVPMLAGILELVPWVKQWHNEPNAEYGGERLGDYFGRFVDDECRALGVTQDDLRAWRPETKAAKRAAKVAAKAAAAEDETPELVPKKRPRKPKGAGS